MEKITSIADLTKLKQAPKNIVSANDNTSTSKKVIIKVAMATCGIASGAQETFDYFVQELKRQNIKATIRQTGCMTYCYAEPTVEVTLPNEDPIVYGNVNSAKAQEIIDSYINQHKLVDGIIPASYKSI